MPKGSSQCVFGPVPSRRLGRSLGVDLVPMKTCTLDCVYCQIGRTTTNSTQRGEFVPLEGVLGQLSEALSRSTRPDHITLAGSGEPTLYRRMGEMIDRIHDLTDVPVAVLTNGTLLFDPAVRDELGRADLIMPSLDAGDADTFAQINRPAEGISFENLLGGLREFCRTHGTKVCLEVFVVKDINDSDEQMAKIVSIVSGLAVSRVQLNTAVRPPAESTVQPVERQRLTELANRFDPPGEIIADFPKQHAIGAASAKADDILDTLRRRPCTVEDLASGLNVLPDETAVVVEDLLRAGRIRFERRQGQRYYLAT